MKTWIKLLVVMSAVVLAVGCDKGDTGDESGEAVAAEGEEGAAEGEEGAAEEGGAALELIAVESMGLRIEMQPGATVMPGAGESAMISNPDGSCTVMLAPLNDFSPDYARTISSIERGMAGGQLREMIRNEQAEGGWVIEYTTAAMSNPDETRYAVNTRVVVEGTPYDCSRVSRTAEDAACVLRACQSLTR